MTLAEATAEFEAQFSAVVIGPARAHAFDGPDSEFIAFGMGARHLTDGHDGVDVLMPGTEDLAINALFNALRAYAYRASTEGKTILIWRVRPETDMYPGHRKLDLDPVSLCLHDEDVAPYWKAYARLLIADRLPDQAVAA